MRAIGTVLVAGLLGLVAGGDVAEAGPARLVSYTIGSYDKLSLTVKVDRTAWATYTDPDGGVRRRRFELSPAAYDSLARRVATVDAAATQNRYTPPVPIACGPPPEAVIIGTRRRIVVDSGAQTPSELKGLMDRLFARGEAALKHSRTVKASAAQRCGGTGAKF